MRRKKLVILVGIFLAGALVCIFAPGFIRLRELRARKAELEREIERLRESNRKLQKEKERLEHDPIYIEKMIRQKLGVAKPDETIYKIVPQEEEKE